MNSSMDEEQEPRSGDGSSIFNFILNPVTYGRYHALILR